jgi:plasmid stabilization system protein ParE
MTIEWLPGAILDLQRLREFLRPLNIEAGNKAVTAIKAAVKLLTPHHYGKPAEGLPDYYDVVIPFGASGYVLRYRVEGDMIFIVALKHTKEVGFIDNL